MPDETDLMQQHQDNERETLLERAHARAANIPTGQPGECMECGEYSPRLVASRCAPCRDQHRA